MHTSVRLKKRVANYDEMLLLAAKCYSFDEMAGSALASSALANGATLKAVDCSVTSNGWNALHWAVWHGDIQVIKLILSSSCCRALVNAQTSGAYCGGWFRCGGKHTALHIVSYRSSYPLVKKVEVAVLLLEAGAKSDVLDSQNRKALSGQLLGLLKKKVDARLEDIDADKRKNTIPSVDLHRAGNAVGITVDAVVGGAAVAIGGAGIGAIVFIACDAVVGGAAVAIDGSVLDVFEASISGAIIGAACGVVVGVIDSVANGSTFGDHLSDVTAGVALTGLIGGGLYLFPVGAVGGVGLFLIGCGMMYAGLVIGALPGTKGSSATYGSRRGIIAGYMFASGICFTIGELLTAGVAEVVDVTRNHFSSP